MFAMVVDGATTMGDAIAIVDCCSISCILDAAAEAEKCLVLQKGTSNKLKRVTFPILITVSTLILYTVPLRPT